jgi:multisubunit Na+/H+ antiporter MnhE subunit
MKDFFKKHWLRIAGILVGALVGYIYYHYVGCLSGTCPITSNPYRMMIYGALVGYLLFDLFSSNKKAKNIIE